ncbi:MAG: glycosyltransferase family 2 protein [Anaerolineae bacterium]
MTLLARAIASGLLAFVILCLGYLYALALASIRKPRPRSPAQPIHRFAVTIPAHNEEATIGRTVTRLLAQDYPTDCFDVFVVADNCTDATAEVARRAGAIALERRNLEQRGKGYALAWLFDAVLAREPRYDALVVFDADTVVDPVFLRVMDAWLQEGHTVIQGQHVIANPADGWFTAIMYTAFVMDNRLRNLGRSNLGLSSKLMGDAMCFGRGVLEAYPWSASSLTEDAEYRAHLLQHNIRVFFAPGARAYGEMVNNLSAARHQRARWMHGRAEVTKKLALRLFKTGLRNRSWAQVDGAIEQWMPSFSSLGVIAALDTGLIAAVSRFTAHPLPWPWLAALWIGLLAYAPLGLLLERAPLKVYLSLPVAPFYALWRTMLRLRVRAQRNTNVWVRTPRSTEAAPIVAEVTQ